MNKKLMEMLAEMESIEDIQEETVLVEETKESSFLETMITVSINTKMFHWQTMSYEQHIAFDRFKDAHDDLMDKFVESFLGAEKGDRSFVKFDGGIVMMNVEDTDLIEFYSGYTKELIDLKGKISDKPDCQNILDEMVSETNTLVYLLTLK